MELQSFSNGFLKIKWQEAQIKSSYEELLEKDGSSPYVNHRKILS